MNAFISALGIEEFRHKPAKVLSGGTKRKLSFAIALISSPEVAFLDEPSSGYVKGTSARQETRARLEDDAAHSGRAIRGFAARAEDPGGGGGGP